MPTCWWQQFITLILVPPACIAAYWLGTLVTGPSPEPTPLPSVGGLHIDAKDLDLGEIWETPEHAVVVPVRNVGSTPVTVAEFATSCDCSGVEPESVTIPPGSSAKVTVKLDLTHRSPYQLGLARRTFSVRLDPVFQGDFAPTPGWEIRGTVRSRVSLEAASLAFADKCVRGGAPASRTVRATAHLPLLRLEVSAPQELASVRVETHSDPGRYTLVITPNPDLPIGPFRFRVEVTAVVPDGTAYQCGGIDVSGEIQSPIRVLPRIVLLGEHTVSAHAEADITVRLPADGWAIDHVGVDDQDTVVTRVGVDDKGGIRYRVCQHVRRTGDHVARVRFVARNGGEATETASVEVRYHGQTTQR